MDVDLLVSAAHPLEALFAEPRHADGQVEDLADRGALRAAIGAVAAEDVVGGDAALAVGGAGQRDQGADVPPTKSVTSTASPTA